MELIPEGYTKQDIKAREKIIKSFYAQWISEHPDKKIWNENLGAFINIKYLSINETYEKAARNYESTLAVLHLTDILESAIKVSEKPSKREVKNQKQFEKMIVMRLGCVKMIVGLQRSSKEYVQYCVSVPTDPKNKATTKSDGLLWWWRLETAQRP